QERLSLWSPADPKPHGHCDASHQGSEPNAERDADQKAFEMKKVVLVGRMSLRAGDDNPPGRQGAEKEPVEDQPIPQVEGAEDPERVAPERHEPRLGTCEGMKGRVNREPDH